MDAWPQGGHSLLVGPPVHNLRYAQNPLIMFWRQLVVMAHTQVTGDSTPNHDWFEDKWLRWTPETEDIEMSLRHMGQVKRAVPYDVGELPACIRADLPKLRAQTSNEQWKGYPE